jgi:diguanylate cyclase (GGDEF)-like protein/PAS domain S-box-containing protein
LVDDPKWDDKKKSLAIHNWREGIEDILGYIMSNYKEKIEQLEKEIEKLKRVESTFIFFLEHTTDFIYFKDKDHKFTFTSNAFARLTNHSNWRELVGKDDFDIFPREHSIVYYQKEKHVLQHGEHLVNIEEPYYDKEGQLCWVSSSKVPIVENGKVIGLFGISRDITSAKRLQKELSKKALFDDLSGLLNRFGFMEESKKLIKSAKKEEKKLVLYYVDIDHFKEINDSFGHEVGDMVLREISGRFRNIIKKPGIIGRMGGDEFLIFSYFSCLEEEVLQTKRDIEMHISQPIKFHDKELRVMSSIGMSCYPDDGDHIDQLISKADHSMYREKFLRRRLRSNQEQ